MSGYEIIIRDKTEPGNVFDVIKLDGWSSQSYVISKGVSKFLITFCGCRFCFHNFECHVTC